MAAAIDNDHWIWYEGSLLALLLEFLIEVAENSEYVIELYRQNSGTSELYDGDSWQNIVGDLISSTFGYYVAALSVHYQVQCRIYVDIMTRELSSNQLAISPVIYWLVCLSIRRGGDGV